MSRKPAERQGEPDPKPSDLLPVTFAANMAEAEFYQILLTDADIQAVIDSEVEDRNGQAGKGIAVLVPAEHLDEASDIITTREEIEEHILAGPEGQGLDEDEEDELSVPGLDNNTAEDEDLLFRRDPFTDEDESD